jgi:zinc transport system substrate-binding protein
MLQAESIKQALIKKRPQLQADFEDNFAKLKRALAVLDTELKRILANARERPLLASHPVYQYLARAYGLELHSVLWEPGEFSGEPQWKELESLAEAQRAKWMIWEASPIAESVDRLAQMGIDTIVFDPGANVPEQGDFLSVMNNNLAELRRAF